MSLNLSRYCKGYSNRTGTTIFFHSLSSICRNSKKWYGLEYNTSNRSYDDSDEEGYCEDSLSNMYYDYSILNKLSIHKNKYKRHTIAFVSKVANTKYVPRKLSNIRR